MSRETDRDNFEKWQQAWDIAAVEFAKEAAEDMARNPPTPHPAMSYFTGTPNDQDYNPSAGLDSLNLGGDLSWGDIYARSQDLHGLDDGDGLLTDNIKYDKGAEKPKANYGAFTPTKTNPTQQRSTGPDGERDDGQGIRVTDNWSDGDTLRELDEIKRRVEEMERKHHREQVLNGKSGLRSQLESLRDRVRKLSEKINREPETDVT